MRLAKVIERMGLGDARKRLARNAALRIISLLIAAGLWMFVNASQHGTLENLPVPISYRSLPAGSVIMNTPPDFVKIDVAGPKTLLSLLQPERLTVRLDLAGVAQGQTEIKLRPSMFNVGRTTVTRVSPAEISLDIDRVVGREVPVHLNVDGQVATGYQINGAEVTPATLVVSGPSRYVAPIARIETEPLSVKGLAAGLSREVAVVAPPEPVRLSAAQVEVRVAVAERIAEKEFRGVDVEVRDTEYKFKIDPARATITIRGPATRLSNFDPRGMVYVDAKDGTPGLRDTPLKVDLPAGMDLVRQSPVMVKLRIYHVKRVSGGDGRTS
ncbi:MAG TPA: CdaR family protein [Candidatus Binataceae bacterium]|nr:CdaR family protein [Candidatus Binataceae bacterium]